MFRGGPIALFAAATVALAACGGEVLVTTERADEIRFPIPPTTSLPADDPDVTTSSAPSGTDDPPPTTVAPTGTADPTAINFGPNKPPRAYDDFLLAVVTDLDLWWSEQYPVHYGEAFVPLEGDVYAAYPERPDDIPGCDTERTSYPEVQQYVAFYCGVGDFMVYDDGDDGLLAELARDYGAATIGTVLAHEFAHAIQLRVGTLDRGLATILTEQQADCFAGAWTARAAAGESDLVRFSDGDVRSGLIAMTRVSDPVGLDQFVPGGHGSAFDRVGAFQVGYGEGLARCTQILDEPLPLVPNQFTLNDPPGGDAAFGYGDDDLLGFLPKDLNQYWGEELADVVPGLGSLSLVVVQSADDVDCDDLRGDLDEGSALCAPTGEVYFNEPVARDLYRDLGDFSVGYLLGSAWSEAVQEALDSDLQGERRALLADCLTGGWVKSVVPVSAGPSTYELPQPRLAERQVTASAGDLDEAIQTVLVVADASTDDNVVGSAFEKIESFRLGVLSGTDACLAQL